MSFAKLVTGLEVQDGPDESRVENVFNSMLRYVLAAWHGPVSTLAFYANELLKEKHCVIGMLVPVPELTFTLTKGEPLPMAMIMVPFDWSSRMATDPIVESGRILSVCSRMVDYFNDKYIGQIEEATKRADAYEAELLLQVFNNVNLLTKPDARQQALMDLYPKGTESEAVKSIMYKPRPYICLVD